MNNVVIKVENLGKRYRLGLVGRTSLHEDLSRCWARLRGRPDPSLRLDQLQQLEAVRATGSTPLENSAYVWALQNVSLEVKRGEILGIIGRNGAGKSTLLKILTRVTAPTVGEVKMRGRVASLLEVGTGFHPELTGRENIFLNGAIMGMTRAEIRSRFDAIVAFAEVDKFIDTPVKRYSSGMYVRLAFAIAAHLEPEILLVDEVLAVGDAAFQKKCLGKMGDVAKGGRTVLFVSHNMGSVVSLCSRVIWMKDGGVFKEGTSGDMVSEYLQSGQTSEGRVELAPENHRVISPFQIETIELCGEDGRQTSTLNYGELVGITMGIRSRETIQEVQVGIEIYSGGSCVSTVLTPPFSAVGDGQQRFITCSIPGKTFLPGRFEIHVGASRHASLMGLDWIPDVFSFSVLSVAHDRAEPLDRRQRGMVAVPATWSGLSEKEKSG